MDVLTVGQYFPPDIVQDGKKVLPQPATQVAISGNDAVSPVRRVDMRNISLNEINELIRSGVDGLLDVVPIPSNIDITKLNSGDDSYRNDMANKKFDFIGQIENSIKFKKGIGKSTSFLEKVLANLHRIDGMNLSPRVDAIA